MIISKAVIVVMVLAGFCLTAGNSIGAYMTIRRSLASVGDRITKSSWYDREQQDGDVTAIEQRHELPHLSAHAAVDAVSMAVKASRSNLWWAGSGLLLTTVATIWSVVL